MGKKPQPPPAPTWEPVLLGWLLPGLGYYFLKEKGKALLAFIVVIGLFVLGLIHGGGGTGINQAIPITHLIPLASLGCGPVYLLVLLFRLGGAAVAPDAFPAGVTLIWIAGGINLVFMADAYFRARGKKFLLPCLLAWCMPGAGYFSKGRLARGLVFFVMILLLFFFGLALQGKLYSLEPDKPLTILATFADLGIGPIYYIVQWLGYGEGDIQSPMFELGNTFILVAGLVNMLVILDVFDLCRGRGIHAPSAEAEGER
jgi:hypothetical protein